MKSVRMVVPDQNSLKQWKVATSCLKLLSSSCVTNGKSPLIESGAPNMFEYLLQLVYFEGRSY